MELGSLGSIGRYEVVERLGSGGFATVYLVRDPVLDSQVAAKVLADNWADSPEIRDRFIREAQILRRIDSNRVVTVHDIGELASGQPYFVMSLANRGTLEGRLRQLTAAPSREEVNLLAHQVADCIHAVHDHELIHRDIKPSNLLITGGRSGSAPAPGNGLVAAGERLVLGDFGLAKDITLQATGATIAAGTGGYAAPEQMSPSGSPDRETDLYAATAVMYRVVTNMTPPPFDLADQLVPFPDSEWWMVGHLGQFFRQGMTFHQGDRHRSAEEWLASFVGAYGGGELKGISGPSALDSDSGPTFDAQSAPTGVLRLDHSQRADYGSAPVTPQPPPGPQPDTPPPVFTPPSAPFPAQSAPSYAPSQPLHQQQPPAVSDPRLQSAPNSQFGGLPSAPAGYEQAGGTPSGWDQGGRLESVQHRPRWPLFALGLLVLLMLGVGGFLLSEQGESPVVVGPVDVVAGESQVFQATFAGADTFRWTDWNGEVTDGDSFRFNGIVPGTISFKVEAITGDDVSRSTTHRVEIAAAPDAPVIVGSAQIRVGVEEVYTFQSENGSDPEWSDANGPKQGEIYRLTGTAAGPFEIRLVVSRPDGVKVGARRVIQIVE